MADTSGNLRITESFWFFLAYLQKYVDDIRKFPSGEFDPARTILLSTLTEHMVQILRADIGIIGYRDMNNSDGKSINLVKKSLTYKENNLKQTPLFNMLRMNKWRLQYKEIAPLLDANPKLFFDEGLKKLPARLKKDIYALVIYSVRLSSREYFLFFWDIQKRDFDYPRYTDFDKKVLSVSVGLVEAGFSSGVRDGKKVQQVENENQTRDFLLQLFHELKNPLQAIVADVENLQGELPENLPDLREMIYRLSVASHHLNWLLDNINIIVFKKNIFDEPLITNSLILPIENAINLLKGESRAKGIMISIWENNDKPLIPKLPIRLRQMTIVFRNLIHNAIIYSLSDSGDYLPIEISGSFMTGELYVVDITNYGIKITQDEIINRRIFEFQYRGESARQLKVSGSGLGLATASQIIESHGGNIEVKSELVKPLLYKNTFSIYFPL